MRRITNTGTRSAAIGILALSLAACGGGTEPISATQKAGKPKDRIPGDPIGLFPQSSEVSNGQFQYSVPIVVPAGRGGMEPSLSLQYSSTRANGDLGYVGWSLGGLSEVSRCAKVLHRDGAVDGVTFEDDDNFCLDGQKLVPLEGKKIVLPKDLDVPSNLSPLEHYGPEDASSNLRVISFKRNINDQLESWVVLHPNKLYRWYGETDNSRLWARGYKSQKTVTLSWLLSGETKTDNRVDYSYIEDETNCSAAQSQNCDPDTSLGVYQAGRYLDTVTWTRWTGSPSNAYSNGSSLRRLKLNWDFSAMFTTYRDSWVGGIRLLHTSYLKSIDVFGPYSDHARTYELSREISKRNQRHLLSEVTVCDANNVCLPPTKLSYSDIDDVGGGELTDFRDAYERPEPFEPTTFLIADLSGDGNDDVFTGGPDLLESSGVLSRDTYGPSSAREIAKAGLRISADRVADINLDHRSDFIHVEAGGAENVFRFVTNTWDPATDDVVRQPSLVLDDEENVTPTSVLIDFDGDGVLELVLFKRISDPNSSYDHRFVINIYSWIPPDGSTDQTGTGWQERFYDWIPWDPTYVVQFEGAMVHDLNGDGRSELLHYNVNHGSAKLHLAADGTWLRQEAGINLLAFSYFADINGDGLQDAIELRNDYGPTVHSIAMNTGDGFAKPYPGTPNLQVSKRASLRIADFNEDGRDDLVVLDIADGKGTAEVWLSHGSGFFGPITQSAALLPTWEPNASAEEASTFPQWENNRFWYGVQLLDANNDGHLEIAAISRGPENDPDNRYLRMLAQPQSTHGVFSDLLVHVEDGLGNEQEIDYANLQDVHTPCSNLAPNPEDPVPDWQPGSPPSWPPGDSANFSPGDDLMPQLPGELLPPAPRKMSITIPAKCVNSGVVVSAHRRSQPDYTTMRETQYEYRGAKVDLLGRGHLGFQEISESDALAGRERKMEFLQLPYTFGKHRFAYSVAGSPWRVTTTTVDSGGDPIHVRTTSRFRAITSAGESRYRVTPYGTTWSETLDGETRSGVTLFKDFDEYGYAGEIETTTAAGRTQIVRRTYDHKWKSALLGLVSREETVFESPGEPSVRRTAAFDYDESSGAIESQTVEPDSTDPAIFARTNYTYWPGGLLKRAESRNLGGSLVRGSNLIWTSDGAFVSQAINDLGETTTFERDLTFGALIALTDLNGRTTTATIDSMGRERKTTLPNGAVTSTSYAWDGDIPLWSRFIITQTDAADVETTSTLDSFLRPREHYWPTFDGEEAVQRVGYDELGRRRTESIPELRGEWTGEATRHAYDALGRLVKTTPPGTLGETTIDHEGFDRVIVSQGGRSARTVSDLDGRTQRVETLQACLQGMCSNNPPTIKTESFRYTADGQVREHLDDTSGISRTRTFDARGRVQTLFEPNTGTEIYSWNALGDLIKRTRKGLDGKLRTESFAHDALGRVETISSSDGTGVRNDRFVYGTTPGYRGLLAKTTRDNDGDGNPEILDFFGYDPHGRMHSHEKRILGDVLRLEWEFDAAGRLETINYPAVNGQSKTLRYSYNDAGYTSALTDTSNGDVLWQGVEGDLVSFSSKRGAIESSTVLDPLTGQLLEKESRAGNRDVFSRGYTYKNDGRIDSTTDRVKNIHEQFEYDDIGQLRTWSRMGGTPQTAYVRQEFAYNSTRSGALAEVTTFDSGDQVVKNVAYGYEGQGPVNAVKEQMTTTSNKGVRSLYQYDGFGRELSKVRGDWSRKVTRYNHFDLPDGITVNGREQTYLYDASGARVRKFDTASSTETLYHGSLYQRESNSGNTKHTLKLFAPEGLIGHLVFDSGEGDYKTVYVETDHRQSVEVVLDANGQELDRFYFDPFGISIDESGKETTPREPAIFALHTSDVETELFHMQARLFDPSKRRFTTADPIFLGFDVFAYTHNDPVNFIDPDGRCELGNCTPWGEQDAPDGGNGGGLDGLGPGADAPGGGGGTSGGGGGPSGGGSSKPPPPRIVNSTQVSTTYGGWEAQAWDDMITGPQTVKGIASDEAVCSDMCYGEPAASPVPAVAVSPPRAPPRYVTPSLGDRATSWFLRNADTGINFSLGVAAAALTVASFGVAIEAGLISAGPTASAFFGVTASAPAAPAVITFTRPVAAAALRLMEPADRFLRQYLTNGRRISGLYDIVGHGNAARVGGLSANGLVRKLATSDYSGQAIRLVSCSTGSCAPGNVHGVAQALSNKLRVPVLAPSDYLHIFSDGSFRIGPLLQPYLNSGRWIQFRPQ